MPFEPKLIGIMNFRSLRLDTTTTTLKTMQVEAFLEEKGAVTTFFTIIRTLLIPVHKKCIYSTEPWLKTAGAT